MAIRSTFALAAALSLSVGQSALADPAPQPATQALNQARSLAGTGDYAKAATTLEADPTLSTDPVAEQYLGDLYVELGRLKDAEHSYLAALKQKPDDKTLHERLADAYAADDAVPEAIAEYTASLPDVVAYQDLVRLHRRIGDLPAFVDRYARSSDYLGYGVILTELHRSSEAVPYLERAVADSPRWCGPRTALGNAYLDLHRTSEAAYQFEECLASTPTDYSALNDLSVADIEQDRSDSAKSLLETAMRLRPDLPAAYVNYGYLVDDAAPGSGIGYFRKALENDVFARDAYVDLGYDYAQEREFSQAEAAYLKGLSVSPKDGRLEFLLGEAYSQQGKNDLSVAQFTAAAQSDDPEIARAAKSELGTAH